MRGSLLVSAVLALTVASCGAQEYRYRYKLTLQVEADGTLHTGSSVVELRAYDSAQSPLPNQGGVQVNAEGEATVVDLGRRGLLVALFAERVEDRKGETSISADLWQPTGLLLAPLGLEDSWRDGYSDAWARLSGLRSTEPLEVPRDRLPLLVTFTDPARFGSMREVDPNRLDATFGPSVRLVSATVSVTRDPVTRGVAAAKLPFVAGPWADAVIASVADPELTRELGRAAFLRGP